MSLDRMIIRIATAIVVLLMATAFILRADEVESVGSVDITAPPDVVWSFLTDPDQRHRWMESVTGATQTVGSYGAATSSMLLSVSQEGRVRHVYEDILTAAAPLLLQTEIDDPDGVLNLTTMYELRPIGAGNRTRLRITAVRGLQGMLAPYFAVVIQSRSDENVDYNLNALKNLVEREYSPTGD